MLMACAVQVKDFVPQPTDSGFEVFDEIAERASDWLKNSNCDVISIRSFHVVRYPGFKLSA